MVTARVLPVVPAGLLPSGLLLDLLRRWVQDGLPGYHHLLDAKEDRTPASPDPTDAILPFSDHPSHRAPLRTLPCYWCSARQMRCFHAYPGDPVDAYARVVILTAVRQTYLQYRHSLMLQAIRDSHARLRAARQEGI